MTSRIGVIRTIFVALISMLQISLVNMSDGEAALAHFTKKFNREISREYGLFLFGSGASFPVKLEDIILRFQANYCENLEGARRLAVAITHKMIDRMNEDKNLLKYLSSNPAGVKHVELMISFKDTAPGSLSSVMVIGLRNKIFYNTYNEAKNMLVDLHTETFDEAERIVQQASVSSSNVIKSSNDQ